MLFPDTISLTCVSRSVEILIREFQLAEWRCCTFFAITSDERTVCFVLETCSIVLARVWDALYTQKEIPYLTKISWSKMITKCSSLAQICVTFADFYRTFVLIQLVKRSLQDKLFVIIQILANIGNFIPDFCINTVDKSTFLLSFWYFATCVQRCFFRWHFLTCWMSIKVYSLNLCMQLSLAKIWNIIYVQVR